MSTSFWLDRSSNEKKTYDVVIVGAGIAGSSAAFWLKKKDPSLKIALLEKGRIAFGATGRNAGFVTCGSVEHFNRLVQKHGTDEAYEIWDFSEENLRLLKSEVIRDSADDIEFEDKGSFSLASTDNEFAELKKTAELMRQKNIPVEELSSEDIEKRVGAVNFAGGIKYLSDASTHPVKLVERILSLADIDFYEQTEVRRVEVQGEDRNVLTDNGTFSCNLVVYATNGFSPNLDKYFSDKIFPTRGQILLCEKVPRFMEAPCYANFVLDYFRQLPNGQLLIGGFRQLEKETEVGYSDHITDKIQNALYDFIQQYLPQFKDAKVTHRWAGVMGFSVDGQPLVGSLPNDPQVFFTGGFTAHGLGLAFHSGKCLADLVFGEDIPKFINARRF